MLMTIVLKNVLNNEMGGAKIRHREINFQNAVFLYSPCFSLYVSYKTIKSPKLLEEIKYLVLMLSKVCK